MTIPDIDFDPTGAELPALKAIAVAARNAMEQSQELLDDWDSGDPQRMMEARGCYMSLVEGTGPDNFRNLLEALWLHTATFQYKIDAELKRREGGGS